MKADKLEAALKAYSLVQERYAKSEQAAFAGLVCALDYWDKAARHQEAAGEYERLTADWCVLKSVWRRLV